MAEAEDTAYLKEAGHRMSRGCFSGLSYNHLSLLAVHHDFSDSVPPRPICRGGVIPLKPLVSLNHPSLQMFVSWMSSHDAKPVQENVNVKKLSFRLNSRRGCPLQDGQTLSLAAA